MQCVDDREDEEIRIRKMKGMNGYSLTRWCHLPLMSKLPTHPSVFLNITTPLFFQSKPTVGLSVREVTGEWRVSGEFPLFFV